MTPAPTSYAILCNLAQQVQSSLDLPPEVVDTVTIPRAHLRRWLALLHSAMLLLDTPLSSGKEHA